MKKSVHDKRLDELVELLNCDDDLCLLQYLCESATELYGMLHSQCQVMFFGRLATEYIID
jgi:hypothetical protein